MGRLEDARARYETLSVEVGQHKARIEMEPEIMSVMEELQRREHERSVGAYEELLTLFMGDVLPGERKVSLDLRTERGLPALDVYIEKESGHLEDVLSATGGSVTNILSAGLRFIALVRSGQRPFMVLDEADCWIAPIRAPQFAAVVQSVAEQLGVQVLMVSHHPEQMFEEMLSHRVRIEKNGQGIVARWAPSSQVVEWSDDQPGLRSIELIDFQSHRHTFVPLSPGLTLINGDNDIGKSAIVAALRAVFDGDSTEKHINHHAKSTQVILDFGPDNVLRWQRFRKGRHTVTYELLDRAGGADSEPLRKSVSARDIPEWVRDLGIGMIDDIDVQLANQKEPVFLLSRPARERAKALAIGGESAHVQEMLALGKQQLNDARASVRVGEKELERLHRTRQVLEGAQARDPHVSHLVEEQARLQADHQTTEQLAILLDRWKRAHIVRQAISAAFQDPLSGPPPAPSDTRGPLSLVSRWKNARHTQEALRPLSSTTLPAAPPELMPTELLALQSRWKRAKATLRVLADLGPGIATAPPEVSDAAHAAQAVVIRWKKAQAILHALEGVGESKLSAPPEPATSLQQAQETARRWRKAQQVINILAPLSKPMPTLPEFDFSRLQGATNTLARWLDAQARKTNYGMEIDEIHGQIEHNIQERSNAPVCETCGQPIGLDHNLRGHSTDEAAPVA